MMGNMRSYISALPEMDTIGEHALSDGTLPLDGTEDPSDSKVEEIEADPRLGNTKIGWEVG
jgi:hypothetical protein